jgi:sensor histidine kinase YesM
VEFAEKYAGLLGSRYGEKLQIDFRINPRNGAEEVPVFLIQPLIENAIRHAWKSDNSVLHVDVEVSDLDQGTQIIVSDDGAGIKKEILKKILHMNHALSNLDERLQLFYNRGSLLHIQSEENNGTQVKIILPDARND